MTHHRTQKELEEFIENFKRTLERFSDGLDVILQEWQQSAGIRDSDIPERRDKVYALIKQEYTKVEEIRADIDWNVDRGE